MVDAERMAQVADFLYREALALDEQRWRDWLMLYDQEAVFWVPTYTMGGQAVTNPELSINLVYLTGQSALEDRIFRLETGDSLASTPPPRTSHLIGNIRAEESGGEIAVTASFDVSSWSLVRGSERRAGRYEYRLRPVDGDFLIQRKKILLVDETIDGWFDFFSV